MRKIQTGVGLPPKITANSHLAFVSNTVTAADVDLTGNDTFTPQNTPGLGTGWDSVNRISLNGSDEYFQGATDNYSSSLFQGSDPWTFEASIFLDSIASERTIVCYDNVAANELFWAWINTSGNLVVQWKTPTTTTTFTGYTFKINTHYQIHLVSPAAPVTRSMLLYVDGSLIETKTGLAKPSSATSHYWRIGRGYDSNYYFDGSIGTVFLWAEELSAATIREHFWRAMRWLPESEFLFDIQIEDADGDFRSMQAMAGEGWIKSASIIDSADQQATSLEVELFRDSYDLHLSKWHKNKINRAPFEDNAYPGPDDAEAPRTTTYNDPDSAQDAGQTTTEFLEIGRDIKLLFARTTPGGARGSISATSWTTFFQGTIDTIDWGSKDTVKIQARDSNGLLIRGYIEEALSYTTDDDVQHIMQDVLDQADTNGWVDDAHTISVPTSPSWVCSASDERPLTIERAPISEALQRLADQIGWRIRYRYAPALAGLGYSQQLVLEDVPRTKTIPDAPLDDSRYDSINKMSIDRATIRNVVQVVYVDTAKAAHATYAVTGGGSNSMEDPLASTLVVTATDLSDLSISKYGRQFCEVSECVATNIDTTTEAARLAEAICRDLMRPIAEVSLELAGLPEVQLDDALYLLADGIHTTADLRLCVTGIRTVFADGEVRSSLELRGYPTGGTKRALSNTITGGGMLPGVTGKGDILRGRTGRWRNASSAGALDYSELTRSAGRHSQIKNPDFLSQLFGHASGGEPPDSWRMDTGIWGTDAVLNIASQQSGPQALTVKYRAAAPPVVTSDLVPVEGNRWYQMDMQSKTSAAGDTAKGTVTWYSSRSATTGSPSILTASGTSWKTSQKIAQAPSAARFARVSFTASGLASGTTASCQRMFLEPTRPSFRCALGGDQTLTTKGTWYKLSFFDDVGGTGLTWDHGGVWTNASAYQFTAPSDGFYCFDGSIAFANLAATDRIDTAIYLNGAAWIYGPASQTDASTWTTEIHSGIVQLSAGALVTLYARCLNNDGATIESDFSYFCGRQMSNE